MTRAPKAGLVALALAAVGGLLTTVAPVSPASAESADPRVVSNGIAGVVPARGAQGAGHGGSGGAALLSWHGGSIRTVTSVRPIFWGTSWTATSSKVTGLNSFYDGVGGSAYMGTNGEYTDGSGAHVGTGVTRASDVVDTAAAPRSAPSTSAVLAEVAHAIGTPTADVYYPVYSDQKRGSAGYCAWHSSGTINGIRVQFGFFFNLDGDAGCDPQSPYQSQGLAALANVSGHELSEMVTDPQLDAWYDRRGYENSDKCAWTFSGQAVRLGGTSWKIQGNFSNAAYNAHSGYDGGGCIDGNQ